MGVTLKTMPSQAPFFLDAPTLQQATSAYLNNGLTEKAPDGYYSDGTIIRKLKDGKFITVETIPPCNPPCNPPMPITTYDTPNVYDMSIHTGTTGTSIGAIVIKFTFTPGSASSKMTFGMEAELNGVDYYNIVNENSGILYSTSTISWIEISPGTSCISPGSNSFTGDIHDWNGFIFVNSGFSLSYTVDSIDLNSFAASPGAFFMVVPKTSPLPEMLNIRVYDVCGDGLCNIETSCPTLLPSFPCSEMFSDPTVAGYCSAPLDQTLYYVKTLNAEGPNILEYNTMLFLDPYGQVPAPDGYYKVPSFITPGGLSDTIQVSYNIIGSIYLQC